MFSSNEAKTRFTCSGHSQFSCFNQAGPLRAVASTSLLLSSSMLIALVPMSAGLLTPLTCFHCETLDVSSILEAPLATKTCCLGWELCIHFNTVVPLDYKTATKNLYLMFLDYLFSQTQCHEFCLQF